MGDLFVDCYFSYSLQDLVVQTFFFTFFLSLSLSLSLSFVKCFVVSFAFLPFFLDILLQRKEFKVKWDKEDSKEKKEDTQILPLPQIPFPLVLHMEIVKNLVYLYTPTHPPFIIPFQSFQPSYFFSHLLHSFKPNFLLNLGNSC